MDVALCMHKLKNQIGNKFYACGRRRWKKQHNILGVNNHIFNVPEICVI